MDWLLPEYARRFAGAGFATLIFDYRYFGQSEGQPRQLVDINRQRQDIQAAIAFVSSDPGIDPNRVALWGTSLGGGHAFYVALANPQIRAVVAQVPGFNMVHKRARALIKAPGKVVFRLLLAAVWDSIRGKLGLSPYYVKVYGRPGETAVFTDPGVKENFRTLMEHSKHWRNAFTPHFYLNLPLYKPGTAGALRMPLLVCIARKEVYANPAFQVEVGREAPLGEVKVYEADHFDFYHALREPVIEDQIQFLRRAFS